MVWKQLGSLDYIYKFNRTASGYSFQASDLQTTWTQTISNVTKYVETANPSLKDNPSDSLLNWIESLLHGKDAREYAVEKNGDRLIVTISVVADQTRLSWVFECLADSSSSLLPDLLAIAARANRKAARLQEQNTAMMQTIVQCHDLLKKLKCRDIPPIPKMPKKKNSETGVIPLVFHESESDDVDSEKETPIDTKRKNSKNLIPLGSLPVLNISSTQGVQVLHAPEIKEERVFKFAELLKQERARKPKKQKLG